MSAVVCGKRSNFFEESPSSPPVTKRIRCSSSPSQNFSPPRPAAFNYLLSDTSSPIDLIFTLFPDMEKQFLERVLEESGSDLDSAIKRLNELHLCTTTITSDVTQNTNAQFSFQAPAIKKFPGVGGHSWIPSSNQRAFDDPVLYDLEFFVHTTK